MHQRSVKFRESLVRCNHGDQEMVSDHVTNFFIMALTYDICYVIFKSSRYMCFKQVRSKSRALNDSTAFVNFMYFIQMNDVQYSEYILHRDEIIKKKVIHT